MSHRTAHYISASFHIKLILAMPPVGKCIFSLGRAPLERLVVHCDFAEVKGERRNLDSNHRANEHSHFGRAGGSIESRVANLHEDESYLAPDWHPFRAFNSPNMHKRWRNRDVYVRRLRQKTLDAANLTE